ncbi:MAG: hypothetical protein CBC55_03040 [Gammaproteobacteria bacterium TMED95]|nr:MAG: hypothetical protein CBC55_03040 [Gammaproteobacteria bacterium TMED95]|tara:strand:+ start:53080 stop:53946 length:867 start_codon:yes stop_codon:yes gene_type:complete
MTELINELKKKIQFQLVLKSFVANGSLTKDTLVDLLNTTSTSNASVVFNKRTVMIEDPFSDGIVPSTSYKLSYPVSPEQARLLLYMKNASGFKSRAGSELTIEHDNDGNLFAAVTGPEDFSQQIMGGRPLHANLINLEKYAKLDATREFVRLVSTSGIYQVNPEAKYMPQSDIGCFNDYKNALKHDLRQLVSDATHIYIGYDDDVDALLRRDILASENKENTAGLGYLQMKNVHFPTSISNVVDTFNKIRELFPNIRNANPEPLSVPVKYENSPQSRDISPHGFRRSA